MVLTLLSVSKIAICISNGFWKDAINNYALIKQNEIENETIYKYITAKVYSIYINKTVFKLV